MVIFADNDRVGRAAAQKLLARAHSARLHAEVLTPSDDGADWADVWAQRSPALAERGAQ